MSVVAAYGRSLSLLFAAVLVFILWSPIEAAVKSSDCLGCHEAYKDVAHGGLSCTDCHSTIVDLPHPEKLPKPACTQCHERVVSLYDKDVHKTKGLACAQCHNAHRPQKDRKSCATCHTKVSHSSLPAMDRHLGNLSCIACHGNPGKTALTVQVRIKGARAPAAASIDTNGNGIVDASEWQQLEKLLQGPLKGSATVTRTYLTEGGFHTIARTPAPCARCHTGGGLFSEASLRVSDSKAYDLRLDPRIFVRTLPSQEEFKRTVHGKSGVGCADCHGAEKKTAEGWSIDSSVCARCHQDIERAYSMSQHAKMGAARCTDCHNPHLVQPYKELRAESRVRVCARCHSDYLKRHKWLPNTSLHFGYLECATCHSPRSQKSIVYYFGEKGKRAKTPIDHDRLAALLGSDPLAFVNEHKHDGESYDAGIGALFTRLRQQDKNIIVDASIVVTKVYHDYSETRIQEKECITCHSREASFYDSMFFVLPGKESASYIPVKGTLISSYPIGTFIDLFLLGEDKLTKRDFSTFLGRKGSEGPLGFKLIDLFGLLVIALAIVAICIHTILRIVVRR